MISLPQSPRLDPYVYLKDLIERLPTQPARRIEEAAAASLAVGHPRELIWLRSANTGSPDDYHLCAR